jgi:tRNA(fMet)-specific endonuclease VapC
MPLVVVAELRAGFAAGNQQSYNQSNLIKFTSSPNVEVAGITDETTQQYANIFARLKAAGTPIGTNDLWIAACSLEHGLPLLTLDKDFQKIEAVQLVKI